jgi:S-DNA-T family DNA segregation ATPase FtsK/SpoIIIE
VRVQLPGTTGGYLGQEIGDKTLLLFGNSGATLFLIMLFLSGLTLTTNISWLSLIDAVGRYCVLLSRFIAYGFNFSGQHSTASAQIDNESYQHSTVAFQADDEIYQPSITQKQPSPKKDSPKSIPSINIAQLKIIESNTQCVPHPHQASSKYIVSEGALPSLTLLDERDTRVIGYSEADLEEMSRLVEDILADFNVAVTVVGFHPGPVITRFELQPAAGVKVSRISSLSKDLARALSVTSVRIVEIIPGKSVVGLEIPNRAREMVTLRELLVSPNFINAKSLLTLAMGKDIAGAPMVADLGKMPHALVAGTTGSGKSVAINTMILSLLYKATPEEVRLIMIDPKMLELSVYEGIPHLLTPVVTDMKEASNALRWAVAEMERRYKLMSKMGVRNLAGFNQLIDDAAARGETIRDPMYQLLNPFEDGESFPVLTKLPSIVIVIDELADMMMIVGKKVEELIARLAQKARAAGIHLILATQRPSVDVLTGLIKANVPTRISFQVSSRIDSRTILDQGGAETLLGNGDMLFLPSGTSIPIRAHGAFVDDHEVHRVVEFLKQTAPPNYLEDITRDSSESSDGYSSSGDNSNSESDALYDEAVQFVTETRKASISSVQRRFKVGYNRAATMIEAMEAAGVVSSAESNGSRIVLAPTPIKD